MIREFKSSDTEALITIWYRATAIAHPFMTKDFLRKEEQNIRNIYIPNTQSWVFVENDEPVAFISMIDNEVGAIFAYPEVQGKGIGQALMKHVSKLHNVLEVEVFKNNSIGRRFYDKFGFEYMDEKIHEPTNQPVFRLKFNCNKTSP